MAKPYQWYSSSYKDCKFLWLRVLPIFSSELVIKVGAAYLSARSHPSGIGRYPGLVSWASLGWHRPSKNRPVWLRGQTRVVARITSQSTLGPNPGGMPGSAVSSEPPCSGRPGECRVPAEPPREMTRARAGWRNLGGMNSVTALEISPSYIGRISHHQIRIPHFPPFRAHPQFPI
jgi:hypothetical protein